MSLRKVIDHRQKQYTTKNHNIEADVIEIRIFLRILKYYCLFMKYFANINQNNTMSK